MTSANPAYRDAVAGARLRYDELLSRWDDHLADLGVVQRVHAARAGRIAAGSVGIAGAALLPIVGLLDVAFERIGSGDLFYVLLATWPAMGFAWWLGQRGSGESVRLAARPPVPTGDPFMDLARLGDERPALRLQALARSQERASASLPLVALSLLLPLSIHTLVILGFALVTGGPHAPQSVDSWIGLSMVIVGHAHLALAWCARSFARRLADVPDHELMWTADRAARSAYWWTVGLSALPGAVLFLIPPILTAITGALFCKPMFRRLAASVLRERALLRDA